MVPLVGLSQQPGVAQVQFADIKRGWVVNDQSSQLFREDTVLHCRTHAEKKSLTNIS